MDDARCAGDAINHEMKREHGNGNKNDVSKRAPSWPRRSMGFSLLPSSFDYDSRFALDGWMDGRMDGQTD